MKGIVVLALAAVVLAGCIHCRLPIPVAGNPDPENFVPLPGHEHIVLLSESSLLDRDAAGKPIPGVIAVSLDGKLVWRAVVKPPHPPIEPEVRPIAVPAIGPGPHEITIEVSKSRKHSTRITIAPDDTGVIHIHSSPHGISAKLWQDPGYE